MLLKSFNFLYAVAYLVVKQGLRKGCPARMCFSIRSALIAYCTLLLIPLCSVCPALYVLMSQSNNCYRGTKTCRLRLYSTFYHGNSASMMIGMRGGRITYLQRQNKGRRTRAFGRIRTYNLQLGPVILEKKMPTQTTQPQAIIHNQRVNRVLCKQTSRSHMKISGKI